MTPQEQKLVASAKTEGAVTVLNPIFSDRTGERLGEAFIKRYDLGADFKFNNLRKGTGQTVAQVRQEILAKKFTVDILVVSAPGFFDEAAKRGAEFPSSGLAVILSSADCRSGVRLPMVRYRCCPSCRLSKMSLVCMLSLLPPAVRVCRY